MNKKVVALFIATALSSASFATFASSEQQCKARAEQKHIAAENVPAFVMTCSQTHTPPRHIRVFRHTFPVNSGFWQNNSN